MGESGSTIQRSPNIHTSYKFAARRYRLPPMALRTVTGERRTSPVNGIERSPNRAVVPWIKSLPVSATTFPTALQSFVHRAGTLAKGYPTAIQAVLKSKTVAIRKGNKHQLGLVFSLEACQRNAAGWSTAGWPANAKLPLPDRHSSITRPCALLERSSARVLVFTCTRALDRLRTLAQNS